MKSAQATSSVGLAAMVALLNGGTLKFYSGAAPANPESALAPGNVLLVTGNFASTAGTTPALGVQAMTTTLRFTSTTLVASAAGTIGFARAFRSDGTTVGMDFSVGLSGADINLSSLTTSLGLNLVINSALLSMPCD